MTTPRTAQPSGLAHQRVDMTASDCSAIGAGSSASGHDYASAIGASSSASGHDYASDRSAIGAGSSASGHDYASDRSAIGAGVIHQG